jgi:hypothetical protein
MSDNYKVFNDDTFDNLNVRNNLEFERTAIDVGIPLSSPETVTISVIDTFVLIPITTIKLVQQGSASLANDNITLGQRGTYESNISLSCTTVGAGFITVVFGIGINGAEPDGDDQMSLTILGSAFDVSTSFSFSCQCKQGDELQVYVKNITNTDNVIIKAMHWITNRI